MTRRKLRIVDGCMVDTWEFTKELKNIEGSRVTCYHKERTDCTTWCAHFSIDERSNCACCGSVMIGEIVKYETHQEVDCRRMQQMAQEHENYKKEPCRECIHRSICTMILDYRWDEYHTCHWKPSRFHKEIK